MTYESIVFERLMYANIEKFTQRQTQSSFFYLLLVIMWFPDLKYYK